jgi:hypothetical protein
VDDGTVEDFGWLDVCTLAWMDFAFGSFSQAKSEPKGKCWTTGNLERTSALYIFIMPCVVFSIVVIVEYVANGTFE